MSEKKTLHGNSPCGVNMNYCEEKHRLSEVAFCAKLGVLNAKIDSIEKAVEVKGDKDSLAYAHKMSTYAIIISCLSLIASILIKVLA